MRDSAVPRRDMMQDWMEVALDEARLALNTGEAPIGAALFGRDGAVLGRGHNTMMATGSAVAHADSTARVY